MSSSDSTATCALCGAVADPPPITWMRDVDQRRGPVWYCDTCARQHLRAIESRLEQEWW